MRQTFKATVQQDGNRSFVELPFEPDEVWGEKLRHDVTGVVAGVPFRGPVQHLGGEHVLALGKRWREDAGISIGDAVELAIEPEAPHIDSIAADIATALRGSAQALKLFNAIATHYRKRYIVWIEQAKRAETRSRRIDEMVDLLERGKREK